MDDGRVRILIAPDKFKGSMSATEAAQAIREGLMEAIPHAEFDLCPLADGGEGTAEICMKALGGEWRDVPCVDALGRSIIARYGWIKSKRMAVVEMSAASGLWRIAKDDRNIKQATTFGTGELLKDALKYGAETIIVGLGGSATNDGGTGLAAALGWKFLDEDGCEIDISPATLPFVRKLVPPEESVKATIIGLADVRNPLLGPHGASHIYGPQKGASPGDVIMLEETLEHLAILCEEQLGTAWESTPGAGAAGGAAFGLLTFLGAELMSGFQWLRDLLKLDTRIANADLILTGEGSLDAQTLEGKAPGAIAHLARQQRKPIIAFAGAVEREAETAFHAALPITNGAMELAEAMDCGAKLLRDAARRCGNLLSL